MPQVTVYIREEDLPKWKELEKKSEFIHNALNPSFQVLNQMISQTPKRKGNPEIAPEVMITDKIIKTPEGAISPALKERFKRVAPNEVCKIHGTPLDDRGKCLVKGCKYS